MKSLIEYIEWMRDQQKSVRTIQNYCYELKKFPDSLEEQRKFIRLNREKKMLIFAFRSYLRFLKEKKVLNREELLELLDTIKPPKIRGEARNRKKGKSYHRNEWSEITRSGPNRMAKFGIWIGFHFGLRLSEIVHLRIQDIDLEKMTIKITGKGRIKEEIEVVKGHTISYTWHPKHFKERVVSINSKEQVKVFERWFQDRDKAVIHDYILWSPRTLGRLTDRTFQRWCKQAHIELRPHDMRRSYATKLYYGTGKDTKIVQEMLGHSNIGTTSQYLRLDEEEVLSKARKGMS